MGTAARRVKTDEERARTELAIYERRVASSKRALDHATATYEALKAGHEQLVAVRDHLAAHPALRSDEPPGLAVELPVPIDDGSGFDDLDLPGRAVRDEPQA